MDENSAEANVQRFLASVEETPLALEAQSATALATRLAAECADVDACVAALTTLEFRGEYGAEAGEMEIDDDYEDVEQEEELTAKGKEVAETCKRLVLARFRGEVEDEVEWKSADGRCKFVVQDTEVAEPDDVEEPEENPETCVELHRLRMSGSDFFTMRVYPVGCHFHGMFMIGE